MGDIVSIFNWNSGGMTDEEVALAMPDASEAKSLPRHIERCGMRFKLFASRQSQQGSDIVTIKYMLVGLIVAVVITSPQVRDFIEWAHKII